MSEQATQATEKPAPQNLTDEEEFEDEDVVVPNEGGEGGETAAEPAPAPEKKRRGPKRYAVLTNERDQARGYAAQLEAELARERQRAATLEKEKNEASTVAMQSFAAKSETDLKEARAAYTAALKNGDPDAITAAAELLSSAKSTMDDIEAWKKSETAKPAEQPQQQPQQQQPQQIQDLPEDVINWTMDNRYWDRVARDDSGKMLLDRAGRPMQNPEFDEEMHQEATMFAAKLERQIAKKQVNFQILSPEYFQAVNEHMAKEFPEYFGGEEAEEPAAPRRSSPVAPAARSAAPATRNGAGQKHTISADEVRFVKKMVENGGGPKYPQGHPKQFQPMSLDDAKVSFVRQKMAIAKNQ